MEIPTRSQPTARQLHRTAVLGVCLVMFLEGLSSSSINVQVADIRTDLAPSAVGLQLIASAFLVAYAGLLLPAGRLADRFDRRTVFRIGLALFGIASVLGACAPDVTVLVVARLLQGAGAALTAPSGFALLTGPLPEGPARNRMVARYGAFGAVGFSTGLVLPGLLVSWFGWRAAFVILLPFVLAVVAMTWRMPRAGGSVDRVGWLGSAALFGCIALGSYLLGAAPGLAPRTMIAVAVVGVGLGIVLLLRRSEALPLSALARPAVRGAMLALAAAFAGVLSSIYLLVLALQDSHGLGAFEVGLLVLPQPFFFAATASIGARWAGKAGPATPVAAGLGLIAVSIGGLAAAGTAMPHPMQVLLSMAGVGVGLGMLYPAASIAAVDAAPDALRASTSALLITAQNIGGSLGIALVTALALVPRVGAPVDLTAPMLVPAGLVLVGMLAVATMRADARTGALA